MPGSAEAYYPEEKLVRQRALQLAGKGYQVGVRVQPEDPYLGSTLSVSDLFYQTPKVPGHYFEQQSVDGAWRPPTMIPGSLNDAILLDLVSPYERDRNVQAYQDVRNEAMRRAASGNPIRRPR
jgi:hypothetical protein